MTRFRIGIDIGGTFTDFALIDDDSGEVSVHKQLTTPDDPSRCVLEGIERLLARRGVAIAAVQGIVHGMTLVTNAVIERKGARTAMLVTRGFRDVVDIGLERRYDLFDLRLKFAAPVVPRADRLEVDERVRHDGSIECALDPLALREQLHRFVHARGIESVAICLLNAYANPEHERLAARVLAEHFPSLYVSGSADVVPFMREYERWTTATVNAYTQPVIDRYLDRIERGLTDRGFRGTFHVMTSSGGAVTPAFARRYPVRLIESGPAAGILMSSHLGRAAGAGHLLAFDMGGTTAKGALLRKGEPIKRFDVEVARVHEHKAGSGLPLRIPVMDLIEIGAGGGSLAGIDERGLLRVGPRSAGAKPGPVCYGQGGTTPTLTDADLLIGCLDADFFLGGAMPLDRAASEAAVAQSLAEQLRLDVPRVAFGIHEIINEDCARAFRTHAAELGFDVRQCAMVAFGGAGPTHAIRIARKLRIRRVIVPLGAGVFSALGLLVSPLAFETYRSQRVRLDALTPAAFDATLAPLVAEGRQVLRDAGVSDAVITVLRRLDMRFVGQGHEVEVVVPDDQTERVLDRLPVLFEQAYAQRYSSIMPQAPIEIAGWKAEVVGPAPMRAAAYHFSGTRTPGQDAKGNAEGQRTARATSSTGASRKGSRRLYDPDRAAFVECPVYDRYALHPGDTIDGPALIEENESTCVIGAGDRVTVDAQHSLIAELRGEAT